MRRKKILVSENNSFKGKAWYRVKINLKERVRLVWEINLGLEKTWFSGQDQEEKKKSWFRKITLTNEKLSVKLKKKHTILIRKMNYVWGRSIPVRDRIRRRKKILVSENIFFKGITCCEIKAKKKNIYIVWKIIKWEKTRVGDRKSVWLKYNTHYSVK